MFINIVDGRASGEETLGRSPKQELIQKQEDIELFTKIGVFWMSTLLEEYILRFF